MGTIGKLVVKKINEKKPDYKPEGKTYTLSSWYVTGSFNGEPKEQILVKTMSSKVAALVKEGFTCDVCEEQEFKGKISYFLPKEAAPGGGGFGGGGGGGVPRQPVTNYTMDELVALYKRCVKEAHEGLVEVVGKDFCDSSAVQAGAATLLIQATKIGIKI